MPSSTTSVIIHGHFYQPPREDPWLGEVETEPSAAPFHDWNQRIEHECYRAVVAARVPGADGRIARIVNTLASISFNFGATLLEWMEGEAPETYAAVLAADQQSLQSLGVGNAMAMPYHHVILPLCSRRDKVTEVRWGIADFQRRFGREPEGMWLPETAVDEETLDVLASAGIRFTVLAPHQVESAPARGLPGVFRASGGRSLAIFVYDGPISHDMAFGDLLQDAPRWADRLLAHRSAALVAAATDGETFGHHHRFGEMALAAVLDELRQRPRVQVENFGSFLKRHPARTAVKLKAPSSWSCAHGVERWRSDCGCRVKPESRQQWRGPLRAGLNWLAEQLHQQFEQEGGPVLGDVWAARDAYGDGARRADGVTDSVRGRELLEMERDALRMFTSCGWFFDDIGGIETIQVLRYAARAIELAGDADGRLERGLLEHLGAAVSNDAKIGDGRKLYLARVRTAVPAPMRVAAGQGALHEVAPGAAIQVAGYQAERHNGRVAVKDRRTGRGWEFAVSIDRRSLADVTVTVMPSDGGRPATLVLEQVPERMRTVVERGLRRAVIKRCFSADELEALVSGTRDIATLAPAALTRAIRELARDQSASVMSRVGELLELSRLLGLGVPFEAQTAFYSIWSAARPELSEQLQPLAWRLGFVNSP